MDLQRAKEILVEEADDYSDKEILEILDLLQGIEETIWKEYQKEQIKKLEENTKKRN